MPLPLTVSCSSKIQIGFTFLVPAHPGSPGQRAVKRVCVCVLVWRLRYEWWNFTVFLLFANLPSVLWHCWLGGRKGIRPVKKLSSGVLAWLSVWSEVQTCIWLSWCHCHSLSLAPVKSRSVLLFWYRLTWVVPEIGPLKRVCVCVFILANCL